MTIQSISTGILFLSLASVSPVLAQQQGTTSGPAAGTL